MEGRDVGQELKSENRPGGVPGGPASAGVVTGAGLAGRVIAGALGAGLALIATSAIFGWTNPSLARGMRAYLAAGGASTSLNVGTGIGWTVREVIDAAEKVTGRRVPVVNAPRREGDPAGLVADPSLAARTLGWKSRFPGIETQIEHAWRWFQKS